MFEVNRLVLFLLLRQIIEQVPRFIFLIVTFSFYQTLTLIINLINAFFISFWSEQEK
jgi:hypothetical protein